MTHSSRETEEAMSRPGSQSILFAVLAAGAGSRFEGPEHKLLASFGDSTVIDCSVRAALAASAQLEEGIVTHKDVRVTSAGVVVIVGLTDLSSAVPPAATIVQNPNPERGLASSLGCAVAEARRLGVDAIVVGLADQPSVEADCWSSVAVRSHELVTATFNGVDKPPVKVARTHWDALPTSGETGAKGIFGRVGQDVARIACLGEGFDIDTQEDLTTWS